MTSVFRQYHAEHPERAPGISDRNWSIWERHVVAGISQTELAAELGRSQKAVWEALKRVMRRQEAYHGKLVQDPFEVEIERLRAQANYDRQLAVFGLDATIFAGIEEEAHDS